MDIRTLPELERDIYNRLRKKYSLTFDRLKFGEDAVRLLTVADLEEVLDGKDPFANVSEFPFWVKLWESAIILAYTLHGLPNSGGKRLLEVGAGLGAPGLAAAVNGFDVTITDYEDVILDFQRVSAAASGLDNVKCSMLDWLDPPEMEPFDVLAGAEVLFREEFFQPLLDVFNTYLKKDGLIFLAHDARRQSLPKFLELAGKDYEIAGKAQQFRKDGKDVTIIVNRLRKKA
ncbi:MULTISPECIES: class I SAM-dependent methyltransferase [Desulfosediminicola]|uniref:class I SAM-dependent methyltransferase n=1 Tax=Desulfosediminicola TaxID=2886823 RepID=UPI0010AB9DB6|nr:methyltransferase domain-containing protein [Desulfosediminicola ganghwensis]